MFQFKLPTVIILITFAFNAKSAPIGAGELTLKQNAILEERIIKLATLKYYDRDLDTITAEDVIDAVNEAYEREIAVLEEEKQMKLEDVPIDLEPYRTAMENTLREQGIEEAIVEKSFKIVELLVLKFHDSRDIKNITGEDYFEALLSAYDKEIRRLEILLGQ